MSEETTTPRSDESEAAVNEATSRNGQRPSNTCYTRDARQLERDLSTAHATIKRLTEDLNGMQQLYDESRLMLEQRCNELWSLKQVLEKRQASIVHYKEEAAQALARVEETKDDAAIVEWLTHQVVNVRTPLPYGSRDLFWASPEDCDGDPSLPSDLRKQAVAAMTQA